MSEAIAITLIICVTLIVLAWIGNRGKTKAIEGLQALTKAQHEATKEMALPLKARFDEMARTGIKRPDGGSASRN